MKIDSEYAVQMHDINKRFGSFCALNGINLEVKKGTIHALLGENGAGKSTLMNILYGFYQPDGGEIYLYGEKENIKNSQVAIQKGIGMVHQHFMLVDNFTVGENIILGNELTDNFGVLNMRRAKEEVKAISKRYGLFVDVDAKIKDISVGMQQRVEILKALYRGVDILILDEPTAVLTPQEIQDLTQIMKSLTENGKTVIIITHKLKEIKDSADFCTIIRRGKYIDTVEVSGKSQDDLATMMVGRKVSLIVEKSEAKPKDIVFQIDSLVVKDKRGINRVKGLDLKVRAGEIVGVAGIEGNGQKELVEAITCLVKSEGGTIKINEKEVQNTRPINVIKNKISTIHEDRQRRGLILDFTVAENMILEKYREYPYNRRGVINSEEMLKFAKNAVDEYGIKPEGCETELIRGLSGGNQQKVIIAREIANEPDLLIAVQPTRGLDVGAIEYVHKTLIRERDKGRAILLVSLELDEIMNVADEIAVIYDGAIVGTFKQGEVDENTIGLLMSGGNTNANISKNA